MANDKEKFLEIAGRVATGKIELITALAEIGCDSSIGELGFAKIDHSREQRCGFPEFIYGEGKTTDQVIAISKSILGNGNPVLATRISEETGKLLEKEFSGRGEYDETANTFIIRDNIITKENGKILVLTAGTTDLPAAMEAKYTVEVCGYEVELLADSGVAGIHRLLSNASKLKDADVIIVAAGMEGALPSIVGGMVSCPVIAIPTSVGYGASLGGLTAMFAMLNSCASGITVVNIDNGFGAACAAVRILNSINYDVNLK